MKRLYPTLLAAALACSTGCATIVTGGGEDQSVRVASNPKGADVYVDDQLAGQTPISIRLTRKDDHVVRVEKLGYVPFERNVKSGFNGWMIGNVLFGGIVGLVVDLVSGANPALSPTNINARLKQDPTPATTVEPAPAEKRSPWTDPRYTGATTPAQPARAPRR